MSVVERIVGAVTDHTRVAIAVMLVLSAVIGAGAGAVEQESSLEQFQSDTPEADASDYIETNFSTGPENTTFVQVIVRGDNVLDRESLVASLEYQQRLREDSRINGTLVENSPSVGIANVIARTAISQRRFQELQQELQQYPFLNVTGQPSPDLLDSIGTQIEQRATDLNTTGMRLGEELLRLTRNRTASIDDGFVRVNQNTPVELDAEDKENFTLAAQTLRNDTPTDQIRERISASVEAILANERRNLRSANVFLRSQRGQQAPPTLQAQIEAIQSLDESQLEQLVNRSLSSGNDRALQFMPVGGYYKPGSTTANATVLLITQQTDSPAVGGGTATERITDAQLAMQDVASESDTGLSYLVFGSGIITDEINQSMSDSMIIIGPLALLFVLIALAIGYRDLLDIVLGIVGIFTVLLWTFGFMGWTGIDFNQIFIAVPVLLIGLSIDYAIHIFMRHREERFEMGNGDLRGSMKVALGGVGVALALVTATTVIGFLSNLISPVPPIQDFGVVSSFGIVAAFLVFGVLTPALKIEIDSFLENRGIDRKKRAIGTGGGRLSETLKIGALGARRSAPAVIVLALLISAAGVYGASQVDTSFAQEDFLADDPPQWLKDLPEPFAPEEYRAKANLNFVNERFQREDSQADILIRGDVAADGSLDRIKTAQDAAANSDVTLELSGGRASLETPLTVINETRANNATFDGIASMADSNGDGIPDENLTAVYNALFETNPQDARNVLHRTDDGAYEAARINVGIAGTAGGSETTTQMRSVADTVEEGSDLGAIATGQTILFEIVQDQLLDTVVESLLITLVAVFGFLMVVYRITDGSATLGFVTLIPVALSVTWILGTMYLFGIPFNVLTGMITSLTVGLGVAYSIHISERYNQELQRHDSAWTALDRSVTGTGGALLGSAATTVGGFGTLSVALLPALQQFGIITGLTIIYAFLASVLVLPSLLIVWTRTVGPSEKLDETPSDQTDESHGVAD